MQEQHQEMTEAAPGTHAVSFFDVDGTLVWRDFAEMRRRSHETVNSGMEIKPSAAVADAFRRMRERGNATFICTGRPVPFVLPSLLALEPTGIIAAAGAYVRVGDTVVRDTPAILAISSMFIDFTPFISDEKGLIKFMTNGFMLTVCASGSRAIERDRLSIQFPATMADEQPSRSNAVRKIRVFILFIFY